MQRSKRIRIEYLERRILRRPQTPDVEEQLRDHFRSIARRTPTLTVPEALELLEEIGTWSTSLAIQIRFLRAQLILNGSLSETE